MAGLGQGNLARLQRISGAGDEILIAKMQQQYDAAVKLHEKKCLDIIDDTRTLKQLNPIIKECLIGKMKFRTLKKGEEYFFSNFPKIDFFLMTEGRIEVKWYDILDLEEREKNCETMTLFIKDFLD